MNSILLLGDAHLRDRDPEVDSFLAFLSSLSSEITALYLLGDLFDLWIGAPAFETPSQRRVVEALRRIRSLGVRVVYVEGNRDYHLRPAYLGDPFDDLVEEGLEVAFGGRRLSLAHGDLVNRKDRPYRLWRRLAKGPLLFRLSRMLPAQLSDRVAQRLEKRIALTNRRHRTYFPEAECRAYARRRLAAGADTLVLGHFHQEMRMVFREPPGAIEVFLLPSWREGQRYLRIGSDGTASFEGFQRARGRQDE